MVTVHSVARIEAASAGKAETGKQKKTYLLLWWLDQEPQAACVDDPTEAEDAARERNATLVEIQGDEVEVTQILDYWRRDAAGRPMLAKWKDLKQTAGWRFPLLRLSTEAGSSASDP